MKKSLIALAALAAVTAASAQSTVTLSGSVALGLLVNGTTKALQTTNVGGLDGSTSNMFVFTATEDLGAGLKATAVIQNRVNEFNADRASGDYFINVSGGFGQVRLGKFTFNSNSAYNPFFTRTVSRTDGNAQAGLANNNIQYSTPAFSGLTATVLYTAEQSSTGTAGMGAKVVYAAGPLAVQLATSTAPNGTATGTEARVDSLGVSYDLGAAKLFMTTYDQKAGVSNSLGAGVATVNGVNNVALAAEKGNSIGISVPMGALTLKAGLIDKKVNNLVDDRSSFGAEYALSKRTTLIAELGNAKAAVTGANKRTNYFVGAQHTF